MLWAALRLPLEPGKPRPTDAQRQLATWALQFAPRVAYLDEAVVVEVEASVRLFGGKRTLRDRIAAESAMLGATALAWSTNSIAALALARAGIENGFKRPHEELLDGLALDVLTATGPHATTLSHVGCKTLGDLRALPRGGVTRRFGRELLEAMDQAYGLRTESHQWVALPEQFEERLELPGRVELAPALLEGGHRLLLQLCGWLAARHAGVSAITFGWAHDAMRARHVEATGSLPVRTGIPTRDIDHLERLLAEHLAHVELEAPAGDVWLKADEVVRLEERSRSFLPDVVNKGSRSPWCWSALPPGSGRRRCCARCWWKTTAPNGASTGNRHRSDHAGRPRVRRPSRCRRSSWTSRCGLRSATRAPTTWDRCSSCWARIATRAAGGIASARATSSGPCR